MVIVDKEFAKNRKMNFFPPISIRCRCMKIRGFFYIFFHTGSKLNSRIINGSEALNLNYCLAFQEMHLQKSAKPHPTSTDASRQLK